MNYTSYPNPTSPQSPEPSKEDRNRALNKKILKWVGYSFGAILVVSIIGSALDNGEPSTQGTPTAEKAAPVAAAPVVPAVETKAPEPVKPPAPATTRPAADLLPDLTRSGEEGLYIAVLRTAGLPSVDENQEDLIDLGRASCDALDAGVPVETLGITAMSEGMTGEQIGTVLGAAVPIFCPGNQPIMDEFAATWGN